MLILLVKLRLLVYLVDIVFRFLISLMMVFLLARRTLTYTVVIDSFGVAPREGAGLAAASGAEHAGLL